MGFNHFLWFCCEESLASIHTWASRPSVIWVCNVTTQGFIQDFVVGEKNFVGHCHSVMHEFAAHAHTETMQIFKFSGRGGKLLHVWRFSFLLLLQPTHHTGQYSQFHVPTVGVGGIGRHWGPNTSWTTDDWIPPRSSSLQNAHCFRWHGM